MATITVTNPLGGSTHEFTNPAGVEFPASFTYIPFLIMVDFDMVDFDAAASDPRLTAADLAGKYQRGRDDVWKASDSLRAS